MNAKEPNGDAVGLGCCARCAKPLTPETALPYKKNRCRQCNAEYYRAYRQQPKEKERARQQARNWGRSDKGKAYKRRYNKTARRIVWLAKYNQSAKRKSYFAEYAKSEAGRAARQRYAQTPKGKATMRRKNRQQYHVNAVREWKKRPENMEKARAYAKRAAREMTPAYIASCVGMPRALLPRDFIEAKRLHLLATRILKEKTK